MLVSLAILVGCNSRPDYVLDESRMVDLLVDVHKSEGLMEVQNMTLSQEDNKEIIGTVLNKHNVTRAQYDSSMIWYANNLKLLIRVYSHVDEELNKEFDLWSEKILLTRDFGISEAGDSVELWSMREYLVLDPVRGLNSRNWRLTPDSNYVATDSIVWRFRVLNIDKGQTLMASIAMASELKDNINPAPVSAQMKVFKHTDISDKVGKEVVLTVGAPKNSKSFPITNLNLTVFTDSTVNKQPTPVFIDHLSLTRLHK